MLTNSEMPADAAFAMAGVYLNPGSVRSPDLMKRDNEAAVKNGKTDGDPETSHAVKAKPLVGKPDQLSPRRPKPRPGRRP